MSLTDNLRKERNKPAVIKREILSKKSRYDFFILVEGQEDFGFYQPWLYRLNLNNYAMIDSKGKENILNFFSTYMENVESSDFKNFIMQNVYGFIDQDYDGYKNYPAFENIFMTCAYSIENYIVNDKVLKEILNICFHFYDNDIIENIINIFNSDLNSFCNLIKEDCFHIFIYRKENIDISILKDHKKKIIVNINNISILNADKKLYDSENILDKEIILKYKDEFEQLYNSKFIRGKFALSFFYAWIEMLIKDAKSDNPFLFEKKLKFKFDISKIPDLGFFSVKLQPCEKFKNFIENQIFKALGDLHNSCSKTKKPSFAT